jgi:hypothetical protein
MGLRVKPAVTLNVYALDYFLKRNAAAINYLIFLI